MTGSESSNSISRLRRILAAPQFADSEKTQTAQYLHAILIVGTLLLGLRVFIGALENSGIVPNDWLLVGLIGALIGLLAIMRRGYVKAASVILLGMLFVAMAYIASTADGIFDGSFAALMALVIMAGLLLGWQAALVMAALGSIAGWWLATRVAGRPVTLGESAALSYARDVTIVFILIGVLAYLLISSLRRALLQSRASERVMREQNVELAEMRGTLEARVAEGTLQLRAAADVGNIAVSILDPDQLLREIVQVIAEQFGLYYVAIFTLDRTGSYLVLREATGEAGRTLKERGHRLRMSMDSMVGYTAVRHEPRVAQNVSEDTVRFANPLLPDTQSEAALPLLVGQEVIGALDVQSIHLNAFDEGSLTALQAMAAQVAVALQNAQSFAELQKTVDYTTRQYELSRNILLAQTPNEAYLALGQVFAMFAEIDRIQLLRVIERDANHRPAIYEMAIEWDILSGAQMDTGLTYAAADAPLAALVVEDETVVIRDINDTRLPAVTCERLMEVNAQAIILAPLLIGAEYSGFVAAIAEQPRDFTDNEVRLLKATAEQLGVVLANLQLTGEMRATVERVALLNRRLSGEAWDSYRAGRAQQRVESGQVEFAALEHQLQVPIVVRGETIGAFNVGDNNLERAWQADEISMLQTIAGEVALAIDNARLIEQSQRTAQREKDIAVAADQIHQSMNLETILNTALSEIVRITGVEDVAIQFGTPTGVRAKSDQPG